MASNEINNSDIKRTVKLDQIQKMKIRITEVECSRHALQLEHTKTKASQAWDAFDLFYCPVHSSRRHVLGCRIIVKATVHYLGPPFGWLVHPA